MKTDRHIKEAHKLALSHTHHTAHAVRLLVGAFRAWLQYTGWFGVLVNMLRAEQNARGASSCRWA
jgi:hypothetical protein